VQRKKRVKKILKSDNSFADDPRVANSIRMSDVAMAAGVSLKSVSRVVNNEPNVSTRLREKVEAAIADTGFVPDFFARRLAGVKNYCISVLKFDRENSSDSGYFMQSYFGTYRVCAEFGYIAKILQIPWREGAPVDREAIRALLASHQTDGFLVLAPFSDELDIVALLEERGLPFARTSATLMPEKGHCVEMDDYQAGADVAQHFMEAGHRHFGVITGPSLHRHAALRGAGFKDAIHAALPNATISEAQGDFYFSSGITCGNALFTNPTLPMAVFSLNDDMALGAIHAARARALRVPEDVSICGFDGGLSMRLVHPMLTSVAQPVAKMAELAVRMIIAPSTVNLSGNVLRYKLLENGTVAKVNLVHDKML
jgi:LacI family transcriptional regulator